MSGALQSNMSSPHRTPFISQTARLLFFVSASILFSEAFGFPLPEAVPATLPLNHNGVISTTLYSKRRTFYVRVAAATCAAVSMTTSFIAFYWFCRMEKRFRHRLIMLLIFGDALKATLLLIFAIVSIAGGTVYTRSSFCQASGFLVQYGTETADYAVLVMALHSAKQVFRPSATSRNDGLYRFRVYIYFGAIFFPTIMSSLAFINPHWGYMSQGAFCSLPLRPFWYRLALAWIPRYLIAITIFGIAVAIYMHVGFEFRAFSEMENSVRPSISEVDSPTLTATSFGDGDGEANLANRDGDVEDMQLSPGATEPTAVLDFAACTPYSTSHQLGAVAQRPSMSEHGEPTISRSTSLHNEKITQSISTGPRRSSVTFSQAHNPPLADSYLQHQHYNPLQRGSIVNANNCPSSHPDVPTNHDASASSSTSFPLSASAPSAPSTSHSHSHPNPNAIPNPHAPPKLSKERARIHKQLRLIFIYPLVYILLWLIPFVVHCLNYQDKYAVRPLWFLNLMATICVTSMGAVDCLVFSCRERPWRYIAGADGTFWGSFKFWTSFGQGGGGLGRVVRGLSVDVWGEGRTRLSVWDWFGGKEAEVEGVEGVEGVNGNEEREKDGRGGNAETGIGEKSDEHARKDGKPARPWRLKRRMTEDLSSLPRASTSRSHTLTQSMHEIQIDGRPLDIRSRDRECGDGMNEQHEHGARDHRELAKARMDADMEERMRKAAIERGRGHRASVLETVESPMEEDERFGGYYEEVEGGDIGEQVRVETLERSSEGYEEDDEGGDGDGNGGVFTVLEESDGEEDEEEGGISPVSPVMEAERFWGYASVHGESDGVVSSSDYSATPVE